MNHNKLLTSKGQLN